MPKLYIDEDGKTSVYEILESEVTIGRGAANAVQLRDRRASKHHALIRQERGRIKLVDLESKNGTRVNGTYRNQAFLAQGDSLTVGTATLRLDLEGVEVVPAPAVAAVPAASAAPVAPKAPPPAAPAPAPAAPTARPAPPAARPAPAPTPARAAAPVRQAARAPARAAPRRGRERDAYDDEGEDGRPVARKKGVDSSVIVLVGGLGAVLLVVLFFLVMQTGLTPNKEVFLEADRIAGPPDNDYAAAIAYAEKHGDPGGEDWERLHEHIVKWKEILQGAEKRRLDEEASKYLFEHIERRTRTSGFNPKNALPDAEIAIRLKDFLEKYGDSTAAGRILGGAQGEPWQTYQSILRAHASDDVDIDGLLARAKTRADSLASGKRYGAAIRVYESLETTQRVLLAPDLYGSLTKVTADRKKRLNLDAREEFSRDLAAAKSAARKGDKRKARSRLQVMIDTYGIPDLVEKAQDEMTLLR